MSKITRRGLTNRQQSAFTLIELLLVVAVVAILIGILMPVLAVARETARSIQCKSSLRQIAIATEIYTQVHRGSYPIPSYMDGQILYAWDITTYSFDPTRQFKPGLIWLDRGINDVHACPSFDGDDLWTGSPHTGYNYNRSYIGRHEVYIPGVGLEPPAKENEIRRPSACVVFGDGGPPTPSSLSGTNKFMRAPWQTPHDSPGVPATSGAQAFRHLDSTQAAFTDGHATTFNQRYTDTDSAMQLALNAGFIGQDNSLYDLE